MSSETKPTKLIEGGWMDFIKQVRASSGKELTESDVKAMMKLYITGTSVEKALKTFREGNYIE
jgi:hypothetical protein